MGDRGHMEAETEAGGLVAGVWVGHNVFGCKDIRGRRVEHLIAIKCLRQSIGKASLAVSEAPLQYLCFAQYDAVCEVLNMECKLICLFHPKTNLLCGV